MNIIDQHQNEASNKGSNKTKMDDSVDAPVIATVIYSWVMKEIANKFNITNEGVQKRLDPDDNMIIRGAIQLALKENKKFAKAEGSIKKAQEISGKYANHAFKGK